MVAPELMPVIHGWNAHHLLFSYRFGFLTQMQQANHCCTLSYLRTFVLPDGFFNFCYFFWLQLVVCSHAKSVSCLLIYFERLLRCDIEKDIEEFPLRNQFTQRRQSYCKEC